MHLKHEPNSLSPNLWLGVFSVHLFIQQIFIKHTLCAGVSVLGSGDVAENKSKSVLEAVVSWVRQMVNKETGK